MTAEATAVRQFQYFRTPRPAGLMAGLIFAAALIMVILEATLGLVFAVVFAGAAGLSLLTVATKDRHGRSVLDRGITRAAHWRAVHSGAAEYRSGPFTRLGTHRLPGVLAQTELFEFKDADLEPFALVHTPATNHWAATVECFPDGASLLAVDDTDVMVDAFGSWLSFLATEPNLIQAMITIDQGPDDGHALWRELGRVRCSAEPPALARAVAEQIAFGYPRQSSITRSFVTLTFSGASRSGKRSAEDMGNALATRLPAIVDGLAGTGAGASVLLDGQSVTEVMRVAFDPAAAALIAASGDRRTLMRWDSIGPPAAERTWSHYRHASGVSRTWTLTGVQGAVHAESLAPLLRPHASVARKRVSFIYSIQDPGAAPTAAAKDVTSAEFRINTTRKPSTRDRKDLAAAEAAATEEAHGHALVDVAAVVTVTVMDEADLPDANAAVDALGPQSRLLLCPSDGSQSASFAQGLPVVGLVTAAHAYVPRSLRAAL